MGRKSREVFVGVDSGTQSTKVLLVDGESGTVLANAAAPHAMIEGLPPGHLEQEPEAWFAALDYALTEALEKAALLTAVLEGYSGVLPEDHPRLRALREEIEKATRP